MSNEAPSIEALWQQLSDPDPKARRAAIKQLCKVEVEGLEEALIERLQSDESPMVQASAAKALGGSSEQAADALIAALSSPNVSVRAAAVTAVGKLQLEDSSTLLLAMVPQELEQEPSALLAVVKALGKLLDADAVEQLLPLASHPDEAVQRAAVNAIEKYGLTVEQLQQGETKKHRKYGPSEFGEFAPTIQVLIQSLYETEDRRANQAAKALGRSQDIRVLTPLIRCVQRSSHALSAIQEQFATFDDPTERLALLRSVMHDPFPPEKMWPALCAILDEWPEENRDIVASYIESHIADWPLDQRALSYKAADRYLDGDSPPSLSLIKTLILACWGTEESVRQQLNSWAERPLLSQLEKLILSGYQMNDTMFIEFLGRLPTLPIKSFEHTNGKLGRRGVSALSQHLHKFPTLDTIALSIIPKRTLLRQLAEEEFLPYVTTLTIISDREGTRHAYDFRSLEALLNAPQAQRLTSIKFENDWLEERCFDGREIFNLFASDAWRKVTSLHVHRNFLHLQRAQRAITAGYLDNLETFECWSSFGETMWVEWMTEQPLPKLKELKIRYSQLKDADLRRLSKSSGLKTIEVLDVAGNEATLKGFTALLKSPYATSLRQLRISRLPAKDDYELRRRAREVKPDLEIIS